MGSPRGIHEVLWGDWVDQGDTCPRYCTLGAVAKKGYDGHPFVVANELIASRVGMLLGVPVVPGICVGKGLDAGFLSLRFGNNGELPPPAIPEDLVKDHPSVAAAIVTFDCWVANCDRHDENFAYSPFDIPPLAFDHDRALLSREGEARLHKLEKVHCVSGKLVPALTQDAVDAIPRWTALAQAIQESALSVVVNEAVSQRLLTEAQGRTVVSFLCRRKNSLLEHLKNAQTEGLFPLATQVLL